MYTGYKVIFVKDNIYAVVEITVYSESTIVCENKAYQGSLADCEAYIRLMEGGYM